MRFKKCGDRKLKKVLAGCILGIGIGMFLIIVLSPIAWLCIVSISLIVIGIKKILER